MHWRWDVAMRKLDGTDLEREYGASSKTCFPHGLIGQSWDDNKIGVSGAQDEYKYETLATVGNRKYEAMTTKAMAEGAIEGNAEDYAVADRHATNFKYSRFGNMAGDVCAARRQQADGPEVHCHRHGAVTGRRHERRRRRGVHRGGHIGGGVSGC